MDNWANFALSRSLNTRYWVFLDQYNIRLFTHTWKKQLRSHLGSPKLFRTIYFSVCTSFVSIVIIFKSHNNCFSGLGVLAERCLIPKIWPTISNSEKMPQSGFTGLANSGMDVQYHSYCQLTTPERLTTILEFKSLLVANMLSGLRCFSDIYRKILAINLIKVAWSELLFLSRIFSTIAPPFCKRGGLFLNRI